MRKTNQIFILPILIIFVACNNSSQKGGDTKSPMVLTIDSVHTSEARRLLAEEGPAYPEKNPFSPPTMFRFNLNDSCLVTLKMALCDSCPKIELLSRHLKEGNYAIDLRKLTPQHTGVIIAYFFLSKDTVQSSTHAFL
jgi:hypothetical protein